MATTNLGKIAGDAGKATAATYRRAGDDDSTRPNTLGSSNPHKQLSAIADVVGDGLAAVDAQIERRLTSDVALIRTLGDYIIQSGGKRLRPLTLLLAARSLSCDDNEPAALLGAVIEFIHTATLLHDDVVDESSLRRGKESANEVWGNAASVLVGDFLYSRSFQMMVEVNDLRVMDVMAETTNAIAEGEVMQLLNAHKPELTEDDYMETIKRKTARLFESAGRLGAIAGNASKEDEDSLGRYGLHLGNAFQLIDDALDYQADIDQTGKNLGDDLAEGKATLPIIETLRRGTAAQTRLVGDAIRDGDRTAIDGVVDAIKETGALSYTFQRARDEAEAAKRSLASIPDTPYRHALADLADFAADRTF